MKKFLSLLLCLTVILSFCTTAIAADYDYKVNGIEFTDDGGLLYDTLPYGSDVNVTVSVTKNIYSEESPVVVAAGYNAKGALYQLKSFGIKDISAAQTVEMTTKIKAEEGGSIKAFVLKSLKNPAPLSDNCIKKFSEFYLEIPKIDTSSIKSVRGVVSEVGEGYIIMNVTEKFSETKNKWESNTDYLKIATEDDYSNLLQYNIEAVLEGYPVNPTLTSVNYQYVKEYNGVVSATADDIVAITNYSFTLTGDREYVISPKAIIYVNGVPVKDYSVAYMKNAESIKMLCNDGSGNYNVLFIYTQASSASLMSLDEGTYYNINDISFSNSDGTKLTALSPGEKIHIGVTVTRTDATTVINPDIVLDMRGANGAVIERVRFNVDKFRYNQTVSLSGMFTVPENAENCFVLANVYEDIKTKNTIAQQFVKNLSDFEINNEIEKETVSLNGKFTSQTNGVAGFEVKEALISSGGQKTWTSDFGDYVNEKINIDLNGIDINDMLGYYVIAEVVIDNGKITLQSAEKLANQSEAEEETEYPLAEDGDYASAVDLLDSLGVMPAEESTALTRLQLAEVLCKISGNQSLASALMDEQIFADVLAGTEENGYMAVAHSKGYLTADTSGKFNPEKYVSFQQAVKSVLSVLGYGDMATSDAEFISLAADKGILANVEAKINTSITTACLAQIICNALELPIYENGNYTNKLILNTLNITKFEGSIYDTYESSDRVQEGEVRVRYDIQITAIEGQETASKIKVIANGDLNNALYDCNPIAFMDGYGRNYVAVNDTLADKVSGLLDYSVIMYVKNAEADAELVYVKEKEGTDIALEFAAEKIYDVKTDISRGIVSVYTDDGYERYDIVPEKVYINGRTQTTFDITANVDGTTITINAGSPINTNASSSYNANIADVLEYYLNSSRAADVKMLRTLATSDNYNIIHITAYGDYIVDTVNSSNYSIVSMDNRKIIFDEENSDYRFKIVKDGERISFADIQEEDVLSIAGYINSYKELEYGTVVVTSEQVSGTVKTYNEDEGTITLNNTTYKYDSSKITAGYDFRLGDTVYFYVNARGVLVGVNNSVEIRRINLKYGFATVVYRSVGIDNCYQLRLMDTEGIWKTINFADNVSINDAATGSVMNYTINEWTYLIGSVGVDGDNSSTEGGYSSNKAIVNKVVAYETNSDGKINKVYFQNYAYGATSEDTYYSYTCRTPTYTEALGMLGSAFLNDNTVIFSVSGAISNDRAVAEDNVRVDRKDALIDRECYMDIKVINPDDEGYAAVIFGLELTGAVNKASDFFTISGVSLSTNDEGKEGWLLTGIQSGEEKTIFVNATETYIVEADYSSYYDFTYGNQFREGLGKGDVIIFNKAINGDAGKVIVLFDASDYIGTNTLTTSALGGEIANFNVAGKSYEFAIGFVSSISGSRMGVITNPVVGTTTESEVAANERLYVLSDDAKLTYYDAFYTAGSKSGETAIAEKTDITPLVFDENSRVDELGDIVFMRLLNDVAVEDMVILKQYSNR